MLSKSFYKDKKWKAKRQAILRRDGFMCRECSRYGKRIDADHVHHIIPIEDDPALKLCDWNLISLCNECHNAMHDRNTKELTNKGKDLKKRTQQTSGNPPQVKP